MGTVTTTTSRFLFRLKDRFAENSFPPRIPNPAPLKAELFSSEQMRHHGEYLANSHRLAKNKTSDLLLRRLKDNEKVLYETRDLLAEGVKSNHWISPAGEWLLDNFYLIETQLRMAKKHLPRHYSRQLPLLAEGGSSGFPRVYDIALETISHGDGQVHEESLNSFIDSYQKVTALELGELWAIPIMLRLALIENLRRVASYIRLGRTDRNLAGHWADEMVKVVEKDPKGLVLMVADMARSNPPKSSAFVAELTRRLHGQNPALSLPLTWMELWLAESNVTIEQLVQQENQKQAADQVSISNSINSLRFISAMNWHDFVERNSIVDQILRKDPSKIYPQMSFATRDCYRHVIEKLASRGPLSESEIAQRAIDLTLKAAAQKGLNDRSSHVGFYLIDRGIDLLEHSVIQRVPYMELIPKIVRQLPLFFYEGAILSLTFFLSFRLLSFIDHLPNYWAWVGVSVVVILAISQLAVELVNCLIAFLVSPQPLPRMNFTNGIPVHAQTLVIIPAILSDLLHTERLIEDLEVRFLANQDENLFFGLLTDFRDSPQENLLEDGPLLERVKVRIELLNKKYGSSQKDRFFLFHRRRKWNSKEDIWMGYERKRGKIADLNSILRGGPCDNFLLIVGRIDILSGVRYVLTLDTDTQLPRNSAKELIETMAHPLNKARFDEDKKLVTEGYGILQPRIGCSLSGMNKSWYAHLHAVDSGVDPYTRSVSDVYQDVFSEGSFIGKGIYEIDVFEQALKGRFPENRILSHDLLEGCYVRSGLVSDVQLYEDHPSCYLGDIYRRYRWIRGDWQLIEWLLSRVPTTSGKGETNPLSSLSQWKLFDNLRRSLVPVALCILLILGWTMLPLPGLWSLSVLGIIFIPPLMIHFLSAGVKSAGFIIFRSFWALMCLPYEALMSMDAILKTSIRMFITHRRFLEWNASSLKVRTDVLAFFEAMGLVPLISAGLFIYLTIHHKPSLPMAMPILGLWFCSPVIAWWMSQPKVELQRDLDEEQVVFLRKTARKTWAFFETFVGTEDNWLPPDNYQENRPEKIAHRTSPTNIGLYLLSNLAAHDFGYITTVTLIERTQKTFQTLQSLKRHRGHFYNWYDTQSLKPLVPAYISTVDSGNLAGHLLTLRMGLLSLIDQEIISVRLFEGLQDTLRIIMELASQEDMSLLTQLLKDIDSICSIKPSTLNSIQEYMEEILRSIHPLMEKLLNTDSSISGLLSAFQHQCQNILAQIKSMERSPSILTLRQQAALGDEAGYKAREQMALIEQLAKQAYDFASSMEYDFLYDKNRCLLSIGYNVDEHRLDESYYDLLASEARLACFVGIAQRQIPQESWFSLGRLLTTVGGNPTLMSWSGSMFEYLMPLLVMPTYEHTLLDQTYKAVIKRQIEYGQQRGVPWGISECGYNTVDNNFNYQYRAFGVPGLGFKRRLSEDLVVAPYASALALMIKPLDACRNLQRLAKEGVMGQFGFYEAVDYTAIRQRRGESRTVLLSFLAHHQGMTLLSLAYVLLDQPMQKRFEADPLLKATTLLLQEKIPKTIPFYTHSSEFTKTPRRSEDLEASIRIIKTPDTMVPEVQLLSNGHYHVMLTNAGGGYSHWKNITVTRWRQDSTCDHWGTFCYIRDILSGEFWSNSYQPTLKKPEKYEAIFLEGRAEFRRRDQHFDTYTEIVVSPEDDIELRRVRITNRSRIQRTIDVTSYAEVVLTAQNADEAHPAFSNLFIQTQIIHTKQAILCSRRPRENNERLPCMFHLMAVHGGQLKEISYETDRMQFIGRGHSIASPVAMEVSALSGSEGSVLDPIVSIRSQIVIEPEQSVVIDIVTGMGENQEKVSSLIEKYHDKGIADRVFELAWTHNQVLLRQINARETDTQLYARMASFIFYPHASLRAPADILTKNRRSQSGLWGYTISGDLPLVLLQVTESGSLDLVRQMIQAHTYWRLKGLEVDLMICNGGHNGYQQELQEQILGLIAAGMEEKKVHHRGQILVRPVEQISTEDKILLQSVASIIISDKKGTLAHQLSRKHSFQVPVASLIPFVNHHPKHSQELSMHKDLLFFNGLGGFTADGSEYVIQFQKGKITPAPWINVLANPFFGTVISESGLSYTWSENAREFRLTPWSNDPVNDFSGEAFYLRDEESGFFWSPSPQPCPDEEPYVIRHGFGYTAFEHVQDGIQSQFCVYVALNAPIKYYSFKIKNLSGRPRRLSLTGYLQWVLGDQPIKPSMHVQTEVDYKTGAIYARNLYHSEFAQRIAFFNVDQTYRTLTCDRTEFLGRNGSIQNPLALSKVHLSGKAGCALDPCAAFQVPFDLRNEEEKEITFTLGVGQEIREVKNLLYGLCGAFGARNELNSVREYWKETLGCVQVETPDQSLNLMANGWLLYQAIVCRLWARSAFYQSGGAFGFRDQLQDVMALLYVKPRLVREHLLLCAAHQFSEGDVQHWWHPPSGKGVRTRCSDDYLWLPWVASHYINVTGDIGILDESISFLEGRLVDNGEDSYYDSPTVSSEKGSFYEHCKRAILKGFEFGEHGLPLMGSGDWNDGMNLVGILGKGESVWLAFFLYAVLDQFSKIAEKQKDDAFKERLEKEAAKLKENIEKNGWDGEWYRRGYFDQGAPLGSMTNTECQIDSISQSWSVLSKAGDPQRVQTAMESLNKRLIHRESSLVQLLDPPFDKSHLNPGYIKGYVPGVRENGGQYTHAAIWCAMAYAQLKDYKNAWDVFSIINPIHHAKTLKTVAVYKVEPYVVAADIYAVWPHTGRGGWTWYTGSAALMYRLIIESLLGLRVESERLTVEPCMPADWKDFKIQYHYRNTIYQIRVVQSKDVSCVTATLDNVKQSQPFIYLVNDYNHHVVDIQIPQDRST